MKIVYFWCAVKFIRAISGYPVSVVSPLSGVGGGVVKKQAGQGVKILLSHFLD